MFVENVTSNPMVARAFINDFEPDGTTGSPKLIVGDQEQSSNSIKSRYSNFCLFRPKKDFSVKWKSPDKSIRYLYNGKFEHPSISRFLLNLKGFSRQSSVGNSVR